MADRGCFNCGGSAFYFSALFVLWSKKSFSAIQFTAVFQFTAFFFLGISVP